MIYNDYSEAYRTGQFNINNVAFVAKLVGEEYVPDPSHTPNDVKNFVIVSASALNGDVMTTSSMEQIMLIMQEKIKEEAKKDPQAVLETVDEMYGNTEKGQRLKELLLFFESETYWKDLVEEGIKYYVVEYPILKILCFWKEIVDL